jgi:LCP family protein required for cell wall assembly
MKTGGPMEPTSSSGLPPRRRKHKNAKPKRRALKAGFWVFVLLLLGALAYGGLSLYTRFDDMLGRISSGANPASVPPAQSVKSKPAAFLLLGMDTRKATGSLNTDVIMVAVLNPQTKTATVVSIPRDTYMKPGGFRGGKANSFYADLRSEDRKTADQEIKKVFGDYLKIPVDYLATVNFQGFEDVVDAVGGVKVNVDMDMDYTDRADGTSIHLRQGIQTLNGKQALDFVRYRHSNVPGVGESSDFQRNERQQQVIRAILEKLKSFDGLTKINGIIQAVGNNLTADIPKDEIKALIGTYLGMDSDKITYIHLEGEWRSPYVQIPSAELKRAQQALQLELSGQHPDPQQASRK